MSGADLRLLKSTMSRVLGPINLPFGVGQTLDHFIEEFAQNVSDDIDDQDLTNFFDVLGLIAADPAFKDEMDDGFKAGFLLNALNNITTGVRLSGNMITRSGTLFANFVSHCGPLYMFKLPVVQLQFADGGPDVEVELLHWSSKAGEHSMPPLTRERLLSILRDDSGVRGGFACPAGELLPSGLRYMQGDFAPLSAVWGRLMPCAYGDGGGIGPLDFLLGPASIFKNAFDHHGVRPSSAVGGLQSLPLRIRDEDGVVTVALESTSLNVDLGKYLNLADSDMLEDVEFYKSKEFAGSALSIAARDSQELLFTGVNVSVTYDTNAGTIKYNCSNVPGALRPFISAAVESRYEKNPEVVARNLHVGLENTYILTLKRDIDNFKKIKTACGILSGSVNVDRILKNKINKGNFDEVNKIAQMEGFSEINVKNFSMPTKCSGKIRKKKVNKQANRHCVLSWCESVNTSADLKLVSLEKALKDVEQQQQQQQNFREQVQRVIGQLERSLRLHGAGDCRYNNLEMGKINSYLSQVAVIITQATCLHYTDSQRAAIKQCLDLSTNTFEHRGARWRALVDFMCCITIVGIFVLWVRDKVAKCVAGSSGINDTESSIFFSKAPTKRNELVQCAFNSCLANCRLDGMAAASA